MGTKTNMPTTPFVGMVFRPDSTDSRGVITSVSTSKVKGKTVHNVEYRFEHAGTPEDAPRYNRPYSEVVSMAWFVGSN